MDEASLDRYLGCLLGLACGDAVGTSVEFSPRDSFPPVTGMTGGGPFELQAGKWTDDTSMALCLAESLLHCKGFDARDQISRYCNWWQWGYLSSTGRCFDIGTTVQLALRRFITDGNPMAGSQDPRTAGNGSLMRLAPVVLYFHPDRQAALHFSAESSKVTHAAPEAVECCVLFAGLLDQALRGASKDELLAATDVPLAEPKVAALATGGYASKSREQISGNGYCVDALEAALWCFHNHDGFESTILASANLGEDADTTAAIAGQLAGAYYGASGIPDEWLGKLHMCDEISRLALSLSCAGAPQTL